MDASELKRYIIENDKTLELITKLGCTSIKDCGDKYRCARPHGDNPTGMAIWKNTLNVKIYTPHAGTGDIFTLVMATYDIDFVGALKKIHELLDLDFSYRDSKKPKKKDPLATLKKYYNPNKKFNNDLDEEILYNESDFGSFLNMPHILWVRDGILPSVMKEFNIGYDFKNSRITIPWRSLDPYEKKYVGCVGRTTIEEYELLGIPKYYSYNNFKKSNYIYALAENYTGIQEKGLVVVTESEKSPLKAASRGLRYFVAVGGHNISQRQKQILVSLGVEICISWDSDVSLHHVLETCELFYGIRKVSFTYDFEGNILGKKQSVGDLMLPQMVKMINNRYEYNEEWRQKLFELKKEKWSIRNA